MSKGCIEKKHEETCRGNGNVKYLDRGDGFTTSAYFNKTSNLTLNMCSFLYVNYTSVKLQIYFF